MFNSEYVIREVFYQVVVLMMVAVAKLALLQYGSVELVTPDGILFALMEW